MDRLQGSLGCGENPDDEPKSQILVVGAGGDALARRVVATWCNIPFEVIGAPSYAPGEVDAAIARMAIFTSVVEERITEVFTDELKDFLLEDVPTQSDPPAKTRRRFGRPATKADWRSAMKGKK